MSAVLSTHHPRFPTCRAGVLASGGTVSELVTFCTVGLCCTRCDRPVLTRSLRALERDGIVVRRYFRKCLPVSSTGSPTSASPSASPSGTIRAWAEKYGEAILTARQRFEHRKAED